MTTTKETVEFKAGELNLTAPYTAEGLKIVRAVITLLEEGLLPAPFSLVKSSPKQRIKFGEWEPLAKSKTGTIYKEVVDRILGEYKDGVEPSIEIVSQIMQEMYGNHLKETSIASYVSVYKRYIRESKLVENKTVGTHSEEDFKKGAGDLREIPIEQVAEIWNLLSDKFSYKQVKALIPVGTMQSGSRIGATNYVIREFKENSAFECEETAAGEFQKKLGEWKEGEE